jgi:hypothetical protein
MAIAIPVVVISACALAVLVVVGRLIDKSGTRPGGED